MFFRHVRFPCLVIAIALVGTGCFKNPGDPLSPSITASIPITPVYNTANDSYLWAEGPCGGSQAVQFIYWSSLTSKRTVESNCVNNKVAVRLDVDSGDMAQVFTVQIVGRMKNTKSKALTVTVNYTPIQPSSPGFAIVSAGGFATDGINVSVNATTGEHFSQNTQTAAGASSRTGLQGVLDP